MNYTISLTGVIMWLNWSMVKMRILIVSLSGPCFAMQCNFSAA